MPYYLCKSEGLEICTSWPRAKAAVHGKPGAWCRRYETRAAAEEALRTAGAASGAARGQAVWVDGSAVLRDWSAAAVFFGEGDDRNCVLELPGPHTAPRAELQAVLLALNRGAVNANIFSDSAFVCLAYEQGWPDTFEHQDLMRQIRPLAASRGIAVRKVAGHAGVPGNEAVDAMLREARQARA